MRAWKRSLGSQQPEATATPAPEGGGARVVAGATSGRWARRAWLLVPLAAVLAVVPLLGASSARAASTSPPFSQCPAAGVDTSCEFLIVINSDGTVSTTPAYDSSQLSYDQINDALVGVQNNSAQTLYSIPVSGSGSPFAFDGDGPCVVDTGTHPSGCSSTINNGNGGLTQNTADTTGYGGPLACFSGYAAMGDSGVVGFAGGIPAGGSTWFALNAFGNEPAAFALGAPDETGPSPCSSTPPTTTTSTSTSTSTSTTSTTSTSTTTTTAPPPTQCSNGGATASQDSSTGGDPVTRLYGATRIGTAIALSEVAFQKTGSAQAVVLARDDEPWDALSGGPLAGAKQGPLLLTETTGLDPATACEISRVLPVGASVYVLGGPAAISSSVDSQLRAAGYQVVRLFGADRYATAVAIMGALGNPSLVFEATGLNFPDALAAGPAAIVKGAGILLTNGSSQAPETASYLQAHPGDTRYALGGPAAAADPGAKAIVGADRYDTAAQIAADFFNAPAYVATADGINFPDALAGGPFAGFAQIPLILVPPSGSLPNADVNYFAANKSTVTALILFGGPSAVSDGVENEEGDAAANANPVATSPPPSGGSGSGGSGSGGSGSGGSGGNGPPQSADGVSITASSSGFTFANQTSQWLWVYFTPVNCQGVDSSAGCNSGNWQAVNLSPAGGTFPSQSCGLAEASSYDSATYSYTIQWLAEPDPNDGSQYQPSSWPTYGPGVGTLTPVTEAAGTAPYASTCVPTS